MALKLNSVRTSVTVEENTITSLCSGNVMYTQYERGTTIPVSVGQEPAVITTRITTTLYAPEDKLVDESTLWWDYNEYRTKAIRVDLFIVTYRNGIEISRSRTEDWTYRTNDPSSCFYISKTKIRDIWGFTVSSVRFNDSAYSAEIFVYYQGNLQKTIGLLLGFTKITYLNQRRMQTIYIPVFLFC